MIEILQQKIRDAAQRRAPLRPRGGGTKDFYGNALRGDILDMRGYAGIVAYEPTELVVTAKCGTPLAELESTLSANRQMLAFEPPHFGAGATVGGCVAAGLSGPRRASAGALRDFVLGVKLIDGRAQVLSFGGQVMKNVAGYDVSRLVAGSLGTLGLIAEVSLKLAPTPAHEMTLVFEAPQVRAIELMNRWAGQPLPLSATAWHDGELSVRLSGSAAALRAAATALGGESADAGFWSRVREHTDAFFTGEEPLWRVSVPSTTPPLEVEGRQLIEWNGALRWLKSGIPANAVRDAVRRVKGHATLFRAADKSVGCFAPLEPVVEHLHRQLKAAFDPAGIFNPGRMLAER